MATGNDKVGAIKKLISMGYEVNFRETDVTKTMVISVVKNGKEVGSVIDTILGKEGPAQLVKGSAFNSFVDKVDSGWPDKEND